jgi:hypothetical protein
MCGKPDLKTPSHVSQLVTCDGKPDRTTQVPKRRISQLKYRNVASHNSSTEITALTTPDRTTQVPKRRIAQLKYRISQLKYRNVALVVACGSCHVHTQFCEPCIFVPEEHCCVGEEHGCVTYR